MNLKEVIDTYVTDVVMRLPRSSRADIGMELRGLLSEMLADREAALGRAADDQAIVEMLHDFGTPEQVAARYRQPGIVIIPAEQSARFARLAIGGMALQWALTLPAVVKGQSLAAWWMGWGLGAFWWPGFLVMMALFASKLRDRQAVTAMRASRLVDRARINRRLWLLGLAAFSAGTVMLMALPSIVAHLPAPVAGVFTFDAGFLGWRAPWIIILMVAAFAIRLSVLWQGRWSRRAQLANDVVEAGLIVVMGWWIAAGPIFRMVSTDQSTKALLAVVLVLVAFDLVWSILRRPRSFDRTPASH